MQNKVSGKKQKLGNTFTLSTLGKNNNTCKEVLSAKVVEAVKDSGLTHLEVAKKAKTSKTRVATVMSGYETGVSVDIMVQILEALKIETSISFKKVK